MKSETRFRIYQRKNTNVYLVSIISHDFNVSLLSCLFAETRAGYIKRQRAERTGLSDHSQISSPHYYPIRRSQICMVEAYSILSNMYPTIFIFSSFLAHNIIKRVFFYIMNYYDEKWDTI